MVQIEEEIKVSKYRWIILLIFCLYAGTNFMQFLQFTIITNIAVKYYDIDSFLVDLTGLFFMIAFICLFYPVSYMIENYNLRITALLSSGLTTCGNLLKLLSASRDRFYTVLIGQLLCAIGQVFMLSVPTKLASTWFGADEVSTACAVAIFGTQIGVAAGSFFSSNLVKNSDNFDTIGDSLMTMMIINSSISVATFLLVLAKPSTPPSQSQVNIEEDKQFSVKEIARAMIKNRNYLLVLVAFGGNNGIYTSFGIVVNTVYLNYFPNSETEIGIICAIAVVAGGCVGSIFFGYILDKWQKFKATSLFLMGASAVAYIFVALTFEYKIKLATYFSIPIFGFFVGSALLVGFEFATEVVYPIPESAACSVLNASIYLFAIIYALILDALFDAVGYIATHCIVIILLTLSCLVTYFISPNLRRREANLQIQTQ